jgi:hypothetical protein
MILFGMIVSLILVHVAYPTPGQMYGPRYYFEALGAMALLSARGVTLLVHVLERAVRHWYRSEQWARLLAGIAMGTTVVTLVAYSTTHFTRGEFDRFRGWNSVNDRQLNTVEAARLHNALVFVTGSHWNDFAPFFAQTLPDLDTDVVYAIDRGAESNRVLIDLYPSRSVYRVTEGRLVSLSASGSELPPFNQVAGRKR